MGVPAADVQLFFFFLLKTLIKFFLCRKRGISTQKGGIRISLLSAEPQHHPLMHAVRISRILVVVQPRTQLNLNNVYTTRRSPVLPIGSGYWCDFWGIFTPSR